MFILCYSGFSSSKSYSFTIKILSKFFMLLSFDIAKYLNIYSFFFILLCKKHFWILISLFSFSSSLFLPMSARALVFIYKRKILGEEKNPNVQLDWQLTFWVIHRLFPPSLVERHRKHIKIFRYTMPRFWPRGFLFLFVAFCWFPLWLLNYDTISFYYYYVILTFFLGFCSKNKTGHF